MKKILSVALAVVMLFAVVALSGCGKKEAETLKFGLGVVASYGDAKNADGETNGQVEIDTTAVAVLLDAESKIVAIDLDVAQVKPEFTSDGKYVALEDLRTKYDKGSDYMMAAYGADLNGDGKVLEWNEQADAFMKTAAGKTLDEVKAYVAEDGYTTGDLATAGCTVNVSDIIAALEKAVNSAADSTATAEDKLQIALISSVSHDSKDATEEADGLNQIDTTVNAAVVNAEGKVVVAKTDALQGKVTFNVKGEATVDTTAALQTKLDLGDNYNMAAYGADLNGDGKVLEWYAQAAEFDKALVGKTADEIGGLVAENGYGSADLQTAGCTIAVSDMVKAAVAAATVA